MSVVSLQGEDFLDVNFQWRIFYEGAMFSLPSPKRILKGPCSYMIFLVSFPPRTVFYGRHHPNSFLEAASKAAAGLSEAGFHHVN